MKIKFKNQFFSVIAIAFLSVLLTSCAQEESKDVNPNKIYTEYELFYDANQDKTFASAIFKFSNVGGTNLKLSLPANIKFNGDELAYDPTFAYYRKEYAGKLTAGTFIYTDSTRKTFTNQVNLAPAIENPAITEINRAGSFTYTWIGEPVKANETIGLIIANAANATNYQLFIQNTLSSQNLVLPLNQLNALVAGDANCTIDRQVEVPVKEGTSVGGKQRGKYRALNRKVTIK
ncbi:MAG TPA: hypothetical protein VF691_09750 [Cytophagaceae bacterium]|jgi:hypothetical protein